MFALNLRSIEPLRDALMTHPVYGAVSDLPALRLFMSHHAYAVWDFMSLLKSVQQHVAPASVPWTPVGDASLRYFINGLVLAEESDEGLPDSRDQRSRISHFELYCDAMREIGADPIPVLEFVDCVRARGVQAALSSTQVPAPALTFMRTTFELIESAKPHVVAAALALGREQVIPGMFRALLNKMGILEHGAPAFRYYLHRHVHLDDESHGPMAMRLLHALCAGDSMRIAEARSGARRALSARLRFWDEVYQSLTVAAPCNATGSERVGVS